MSVSVLEILAIINYFNIVIIMIIVVVYYYQHNH